MRLTLQKPISYVSPPMSDATADPPVRTRKRVALVAVAEVLCLLGLAALAMWLRWPALDTEGFHNEDAAGITYNADLLRHGLVPLVDNLEFKAPASFFVTYVAWGLFGRSIVTLQWVAAFWSLLAALGIYTGGRLLSGRRSALVATLLYVLFAPITDSIDINYGAWMIMPYIWATVLFIAGVQRGHWGWIAGSGITLAMAGLLKRQAAVLFPLFVLLLLLRPWLPGHGERADAADGDRPALTPQRGLIALAAGLVIGFAPMGIYYLAQGGFHAYVEDYFMSQAGWRYMKGDLDWADKWPRIKDGFLGLWEYMAVPSLLAAFGMVAARAKAGWTFRGTLLGGHFWLSFLGAALGLRFFKGYYLQLLPAAVWLAAHPDGALVRWLRRENWPAGVFQRAGRVGLLLCFVLALLPAGLGDFDNLGKIRKWRRSARDRDARRVARIIKENSTPSDRIWVWGRWAWPVYFHADRLAASRYYKVLGVITNNLTGTWRRKTEKTRFEPSGPWRELMDDLQRVEPVFIAVAHNEDYKGFDAFKRLLKEQYRKVRHTKAKGITLYRHQDHELTRPPKPRKRKRKPKAKRDRKGTAAKPTRPLKPHGPNKPPKRGRKTTAASRDEQAPAAGVKPAPSSPPSKPKNVKREP